MQNDWTKVADIDDVPEFGTLLVAHADSFVCLYNLAGKIFATQDACTHAEASLSEGFIYDDNIECPLHQGLFHIPSGKAVGAPCSIDLKVYSVKVDHGSIYLRG